MVADGITGGVSSYTTRVEFSTNMCGQNWVDLPNRPKGAFMADKYTVVRSMTINATPEKIYSHVGNLRSWGSWSPWDALDPDMTKTFEGEDGEPGSSYHWTGNRKVGEGRMQVIEVDAPRRVSTALEFIKPFKSKSTTEFSLEPTGSVTRVTWSMKGDHTIMSKVMGIFKSMDKMVGPDFEKGLEQLKAVSEA